MADARVFITIMVFVIYVESTVLSGKGLLCRDPDTGKLHRVNTTWSATSFCGNYTCKLRRLNSTEAKYPQIIREFNIPNVTNKFNNENGTEKNKSIEPKLDPNIKTRINEYNEPRINEYNEPKNTEYNEPRITEYNEPKITEYNKPKITEYNEPKITEYNEPKHIEYNEPKQIEYNEPRIPENNERNSDTNSNDDRYLTEKEIKTISEILHTVKKSDLDAIVDIYNLAQEIYNEMDKGTDQSAIDDAVNTVKEKLYEFKLSDGQNEYLKPASYWYDWKTRAEMGVQPTNIVSTTNKLKKEANLPSYFNGPLTKKDFGKIPYYYPMSSFQRMATYIHKPAQPTKSNIVEKPPCAKASKTTTKDSQKLIKPSYLLPYPFAYVHNHNISKQPSYYNNPWIWDYYYRNKQSNPYFKAYIAHIPNAVLVNPHLSDPFHIEQKPVDKLKKNTEKMFEKDTKPDWKTEPLSNKVLNEVKANIDTSQLIKAFPLRKKVKVEKVGKLIKMDEITRLKRGVVEDGISKDGEFEAYIDRVTCEQKTTPGYFRYGNLSQPYPHCCPQLILSR